MGNAEWATLLNFDSATDYDLHHVRYKTECKKLMNKNPSQTRFSSKRSEGFSIFEQLAYKSRHIKISLMFLDLGRFEEIFQVHCFRGNYLNVCAADIDDLA